MNHILLETGLGKGPEEYSNVGDIAMLQVAVNRLRQLFPSAQIDVLTDSPENLLTFCPAATPLDNRGRGLWFADGVLVGRSDRPLMQGIVKLLVQCKRALRVWGPALFERILTYRLQRQKRVEDSDSLSLFASAMRRADMLVISGAGGFYDGDSTWNLEILELLEAAIQRKIPTALLGQGFGPLKIGTTVWWRASKILPKVDLITLRGGKDSYALLRTIGVNDSKLEITGDEAIELAYEARTCKTRQGVGINVRFAGSAGTNEEDLERIRPVLHEFARRHGAPLIPLPIATRAYTQDDLTIRQLLVGFDEESDGGKALDTPLKVIEKAGQCQIVVTGAYHAAVFALGQGIPVVALAKSEYFASKMIGLSEQFGEGCQTVDLRSADVSERLRLAIESAWNKADQLRGPLLAAAQRQIEASRRSYKRLSQLTDSVNEISAHSATAQSSRYTPRW